jgi:membrane dipeptidase
MTKRSGPVVDGLIFYSDGDPTPLLEGGVSAVNLTCANPLAGLVQAVDEMSVWIRRAGLAGAPWRIVRQVGDIEAARNEGRLGLILGWQNILPIENRIERLAFFHALGLRVIQLSYNEASLVADGCLERRPAGLTAFGREVVAEMNRLGIAIDLSHCAETVALEAAEITSKPILVTHANARAVFEQPRNKSDEVIRAVAGTGGVIGLSIHGFMNWDGDPGHPASLDGLVANVRHVRDIVGADHIGIGTDYASLSHPRAADFFLEMSEAKYQGTAGAYIRAFGNTLEGRYPAEVPTPRHYPRIFDALSDGGFSDAEIDGIAGGNFFRAFGAIWQGSET